MASVGDQTPLAGGCPAHPFRIERIASARDVDVQGRVSNVAVLRWMIDAAVEHSEALEWPHERYVELGGFFVVRRHEIDYLASVGEGDEVVVATWPSAIARASAERRYFVTAAKRVLARAVTKWSFVDVTTGRPRRIPAVLLAAFDPKRFGCA